jgi:nucleotide-binding universal stress UspA family protein
LTPVNIRRAMGCHSPRMFRRILVATDGSRLATRAVTAAISLANSVGARLVAFYAAPTYPLPVYGDAQLHDRSATSAYAELAARDAERVLGPVQRRAAAAGITCELVHTTSDAPWQAILTAAKAEKADLVVMASHGRRGMSALMLGSETSKVLTHSKLPVLVVR